MTAAGSVRFDPLDPDFVASPYDRYRALRDHDPVHWSDLLQGWLLTRHEHVVEVLRDPTMSSNIANASPTPVTERELEELERYGRAAETIVHMDDPDHGRVRRLLAEPFRVREVAKLGPIIDRRVTAALDALRDERGGSRAPLDLVADLAYPLPVDVFSQWLGVPDEAAPRFREWTSWVARSRDPLADDERAAFFTALASMYEYLADQAEQKRAHPSDDLLSYLVHGDGDGDGALTQTELMAQLVTLYMAGHEPTAGMLGNAVLALLDHPAQLERLRDDLDLVRHAVLEFLRYDGPNQFVRRVTTQPMDLDGVAVPAGAVLYVGLASANRDPRRWGDDADVLVIDRPDAAQHLQFAGGIHACLGAHLARLQIERFLTAFLARLDGLELAGTPAWSRRMFIRGLRSLPVRCTVL